MGYESKKQLRWDQAKEALLRAVEEGDAKKAGACVKKLKEASIDGLGHSRGEVLDRAFNRAISKRGETAAEVCEALMTHGISPAWGWRGALSAWQFARSDEEAAQSRRVAEALIKAGATAELEGGWPAISGESESPLWSVCHYPNGQPKTTWDLAVFLLDHGANPNHLNGANESVLWGCLQPTSYEYCSDLSGKLAALLLSHGADPTLGAKGAIPLEAVRDPGARESLNPGACEVLTAWAQAAELRESLRADPAKPSDCHEKPAVRRGL